MYRAIGNTRKETQMLKRIKEMTVGEMLNGMVECYKEACFIIMTALLVGWFVGMIIA